MVDLDNTKGDYSLPLKPSNPAVSEAIGPLLRPSALHATRSLIAPKDCQ
jgi:hypothetical protein